MGMMILYLFFLAIGDRRALYLNTAGNPQMSTHNGIFKLQIMFP